MVNLPSFIANLHKVWLLYIRWTKDEGTVFSGHVVPPEKVHTKLFVGSEEKFTKPRHPAVARYNQQRTEAQVDKMKERLIRKEWKLRKRLAAHGIDYDFPGFVCVVDLVTDSRCSACSGGKYRCALCSYRLHRCRRKSPRVPWMLLHVVT